MPTERHPGSVWIDANGSSLPENEWIAASGSGLVAHHPDVNELFRILQSKAVTMGDVCIVFIYPRGTIVQ